MTVRSIATIDHRSVSGKQVTVASCDASGETVEVSGWSDRSKRAALAQLTETCSAGCTWHYVFGDED